MELLLVSSSAMRPARARQQKTRRAGQEALRLRMRTAVSGDRGTGGTPWNLM